MTLMTKIIEPTKKTEDLASQPDKAATPEDSAQAVVSSDSPTSQDSTVSTDPPVTSEPKARNSDDQSFTWTTSEFFAHEKTIGWYMTLAVVTILLAAGLYVLTKGIVTVVVVGICGIILGIFGSHKPKQIEYALTRQGVRIGTKQYLYDEFQLFIITPSSAHPEVTFVPLKRFMPPISLRYDSTDEAKILRMLSDHLPSEERRPDFIDNLMHSIRF
jgi:hypothetical protein